MNGRLSYDERRLHPCRPGARMGMLGTAYPQPRRGGQLRGFRLGGKLLRIPADAVQEFMACQTTASDGSMDASASPGGPTGKRHRYSLGTADPREAERLAPSLYAELTRPKGKSIEELWQAYSRRSSRACCPRNHALHMESSTSSFCAEQMVTPSRLPIAARTQRNGETAGIRDGTIHTELGHLRMVLRWAEKQGLIAHAPHIERPPKPRPRERHLTREQVTRSYSMEQASLTSDSTRSWLTRLPPEMQHCLDSGGSVVISRRDGSTCVTLELSAPHKGRAIVPMLRTTRAALLEARQGALTPWVIEWAGKPVKSVKRGLKRCCKAGGAGARLSA